ncbi:hypothetical protein NLU13_5288 [Sarocladium strictum]|uniref:Uncharacterized protein n=1 Tax=Sarocladium strictum TaxID=5046 RepID=A0AA39L7R3_SARSR|nr:hypothetical protein NLU13_5288 [Sarocladium strictum]
MPMMLVVALVTVASFAFAIPTNDPLVFRPSHATAKKNAHHIFNEVHSAARQWGSSLNHNGMGFIPAVVAKGTLLHHGTHFKDTPDYPEWLAFEVEHSENFANSRRRRSQSDDDDDDDEAQHAAMDDQETLDANTRRPVEKFRGYLHTYQARRDLHLLYLDGLAAAKTQFGTLDSQDYVIRLNATSSPRMGEGARARELCDKAASWGYDGFIRTEIGFEVIHCNFSDSLDLVSRPRTVVGEDKMTQHKLGVYHFARAASQRYDGIGAGRVKLDFSSMISGYFFPMNISSQTPGRPDLVRFASARTEELDAIRETIGEVAHQPRRHTVDWQAVADQVITRFAHRFSFLTARDGVADEIFRDELESMCLTYYDAPPLPDDEEPDWHWVSQEEDSERRQREAVERCSKHFLLPALMFKEEFTLWDELLHTAFAEVTHSICETTQRLWLKLNATMEETPSHAIDDVAETAVTSQELRRREDASTLSQAVVEARVAIQALMDELAWTVWKKKQPCPPDSFLFVAMWPFGTDKDHWEPGCRAVEESLDRESWYGYWAGVRMRT